MRTRLARTSLVPLALLALACRQQPPAESPSEQQQLLVYGGQESPAERGPAVPRSPDPPVVPGGCTRHTDSSDPQRRMLVEFRHQAYGSTRARPVVHVGDPLALTLECREPIWIAIEIEFCLQRPDNSVLRKRVPFVSAEMLCPGCDPYRGAPPDVCAPEKICTLEYHTPSYEPFNGAAMSESGAYLLSVEAADASFDPVSVIFEVAPPA